MLITEVEVLKEENHSDKHVYAITDAGRKKLPEKIYELFDQYVEDTFMKELTYLKQFINELR